MKSVVRIFRCKNIKTFVTLSSSTIEPIDWQNYEIPFCPTISQFIEFDDDGAKIGLHRVCLKKLSERSCSKFRQLGEIGIILRKDVVETR